MPTGHGGGSGERRQRRQAEATAQGHSVAHQAASDSPGHRAAARTCGWCGGPITPGRRGPIPKWCSATCRHRAWEQSRAASAGRSAVRIVERRMEVRSPTAPTRRAWSALLHELARQLDDGRVYDRDLPDLTAAINPVWDAYSRRPYVCGRAARVGADRRR